MSNVLRTRKALTICRPIPAFIPRALAIDILHDHSLVITLNPLVIDHRQIKPPRNAAADEYHCTWYEITERIQYIPGVGQMGSGKISFNGCFHNMPWGLQAHTYAPANIDLRAQYKVAGNQLGVEPAAPQNPGLTVIGGPSEGLYLRADIEFTSNIALVSFVRSQLNDTINEMVDRMVKKAEAIDADLLKNMIAEESQSPIDDYDQPEDILNLQNLPHTSRPSSASSYYRSEDVSYNQIFPHATRPPSSHDYSQIANVSIQQDISNGRHSPSTRTHNLSDDISLKQTLSHTSQPSSAWERY